MGKQKLTNNQRIAIAKSYAQNNVITILSLARDYHVSKTTISNALSYVITHLLVNDYIANKIATKSIENNLVAQEKHGGPLNNRVKSHYELLMKKRNTNILKKDLTKLNYRYEKLKYSLDTFNETYSSSDEYPYNEEYLIREMEKTKDQIYQKEQQIKDTYN